jgi:hypothetical protein
MDGWRIAKVIVREWRTQRSRRRAAAEIAVGDLPLTLWIHHDAEPVPGD